MSLEKRTFSTVKEVINAVHKNATVSEKMAFYDTWAENYDQDVAVLEFNSPIQAAKCVSSNFQGDRMSAVVLDVACGTGAVGKQLKGDGFVNIVGIDGSTGMMQEAKKSGAYQDLKQCIMGLQPLPVQKEFFDVVVIAGALSVGHVPVCVVKELFEACKPGGLVCMTCRNACDNVEYKASLECELKQIEDEGLCSCLAATKINQWERGVTDEEDYYVSGTVYLYKKH